MIKKRLSRFSPGRIIFLSIFFTILSGTMLLALPIAQVKPIPLIDLFFTATSATCVTGLFTVPIHSFTTFGHCIILLLIQIGGLGLITLSLFLMSIFANLGLATQLMAGQLLEIEQWKNVKKILLFIIGVTVFTESIGALCILTKLKNEFPLGKACFLSLFHAVSSFCNAGISLFQDGMYSYSTNYTILITTIILMFCGGLGFITWNEIIKYLYSLKKKKRYHFSLHSKIILYGSAILISTATLLFLILEYNNNFESMNPIATIVNALFYAVSLRSTGFITTNINSAQLATILLIMIISFIGSSPGSTGSGVKITTFTLFLATIKSVIFGRTAVEIRGRRIVTDQIHKAIAIISLSFFWIIISTFCLLITEQRWDFMSLLFEEISAFATLGISVGLTPYLSLIGKSLIMTSMIVGRIGSLTLILALRTLALRKKIDAPEFSYPEERVMLS